MYRSYLGRPARLSLISGNSVVLGLLILGLGWGCVDVVSPSGNSQQTRRDRMLEVRIKDEFRRSSHVPAHAITVNVKNGIVELFGLVESPPQAKQAGIIAQKQRGVKSVVNRVQTR